MDSRHPRSPDGDAVPLRGTEQVAAGLHARRTPILSTPRVRALTGIGDVGRAARRFSAMTFQSASVRRFMEARHRGIDVGGLLVRPPDYWSGHTDEDLGVRTRQSTGDAALDALIAKRGTKRRERAAPVRLQRGLPSTIHRRSHSLAGPLTAPGGMARRLLPAVIVPAANPANSPQTAASRAPKSRPARAGGRDGDRSRPRPAPPVVARDDARPALARTSAEQRSSSAAPAELDPRGPAVADRSGSPAGPTPISVGASVARSFAPSVAGSPAAGPDAARGRAALQRMSDGVPPDDLEAPTWPGDEVEVAGYARADLVARSAGRPVAVHPLLSGWRSPTAWRSIAGAPGVRLLPVGAAAFPPAWSATAAGAATESWSATVRRAADERAASPALVRSLPVGGPAVIVRDRSAASAGSGRTSTATPDRVDRSPAPPATPAAAPGQRAAVGATPVRRSSPLSATATATAPVRRSSPGSAGGREDAETRRVVSERSWAAAGSGPGTTWARAGDAIVRRRLVPSPSGSAVELTRWAPAPGRTAPGRAPADQRASAPHVVLPGMRQDLARRPGQWLARSTSSLVASPATGTARVPMGPLGPVRWSSRADQPVVARSAATAPSSWAATVAAAASTMSGGGGLVAASRNAPVGGALTLVRGGRADGGDLPVPSVRGDGNHPAANRLRLVSPAAADVRSAAGTVAAATSVGGAGGAAASVVSRSVEGAAYVGRAPVVPSPFVSAPGAVAAHGLPSATSSLVGVTASGAVPGRTARPGALGRLVHGEPVRRRALPVSAPPALVVRSAAAPDVVARAAERFRLPSGPAAVARRRAGAESSAEASRAAVLPPGTSRTPVGPARDTAVVGRSAASLPVSAGRPMWTAAQGHTTSTAAGAAPLGTSRDGSTATPTWAQRVAATATATAAGQVASLRGLPVAPGLVLAPSGHAEPGSGGPTGTRSAAPGDVVHRSRTPHGLSATVARQRAHHPERPGIARRWESADVPARSLPGAVPSRLRPLVAPPAGGVLRAAAPPADASRSSWSARVAATTGTGPRSLRPSSDAAGSGVAPHEATGRILRSTPPAPAGPIAVRPLRPSAPGAADRFDEVLRASGQPVRAMPLPVRYRPLAERIIGRMPVKIATGAASRRALASVGAAAATTSSVIHLPVAPDGSARTASLLAHELTHVAAGSPVARFHGGAPSIEETAASQVERIVARAARTGGVGRGPDVLDTKSLPVAGFVGPRGATAGPPVPASAGVAAGGATSTSSASGSGGPVSAADMVARLQGGASSASSIRRSLDTTVRRAAPAYMEELEEDEHEDEASSSPTSRQSALEQELQPADERGGLSEATLDAIVQALEARLLESIERRGGMWRGGF